MMRRALILSLLTAVSLPIMVNVAQAAPSGASASDHIDVSAPTSEDDPDSAGYSARPTISVGLPKGTPDDVRKRATSGEPVDSLGDALLLAYWTAPSVLSQRAVVRSYDHRIAEARAAYGPTLDYQLIAGWQRDRLDPTASEILLGETSPTTSVGWSNSASLVLTQPLFTFGRNFGAERGAQAGRGYQDQVRRATEQQSLYEAVSAYVGLLRDRASIGIAAENLAVLEKELGDTRARLKSHEVTATDVEQLRSHVEFARNTLYAARRDAASSEAVFIQKIGMRAADTLKAPPMFDLPVHSLEEAYALSEQRSPVLLAAHERERASRAAVVEARAGNAPRVDLKGTATFGSQTPYNNFARYNEQRVEISVTGPLYESGLNAAKIADAEAANDSDWRLIDGATRDNRASIATAWDDLSAQTASLDHYTTAVDAAQKAFEGALKQERAGEMSTLEVLQLASDLYSARSGLNAAAAAVTIDTAHLLQLLGTFDPAKVVPGALRYDSARHLEESQYKYQLPFLTPVLRALDGMTVTANERRHLRDPGLKDEAPAVDIEGRKRTH